MNRILAVLLALGVLLALAAPAEAKGGTGQVAVFATTTSCSPSWSLQASLTSTSAFAVLHVDLVSNGVTVAADVPLSYFQPVLISVAGSGSKDTLEVYLHNSLQEFGRFQAVNPCSA